MSQPERVLLVDDEEETLLVYKNLVRRLACEVDAVQTMEEAEQLIATGRYRVVVTDLRLTGVLGEEGLEILRYVKEKSPGTQVVLVTGYGSPDILSKAYELGAAYYFEKPVHPIRLLEALQELTSGAAKELAGR